VLAPGAPVDVLDVNGTVQWRPATIQAIRLPQSGESRSGNPKSPLQRTPVGNSSGSSSSSSARLNPRVPKSKDSGPDKKGAHLSAKRGPSSGSNGNGSPASVGPNAASSASTPIGVLTSSSSGSAASPSGPHSASTGGALLPGAAAAVHIHYAGWEAKWEEWVSVGPDAASFEAMLVQAQSPTGTASLEHQVDFSRELRPLTSMFHEAARQTGQPRLAFLCVYAILCELIGLLLFAAAASMSTPHIAIGWLRHALTQVACQAHRWVTWLLARVTACHSVERGTSSAAGAWTWYCVMSFNSPRCRWDVLTGDVIFSVNGVVQVCLRMTSHFQHVK
jgi:hypothetical protein